MSEWLQSTYEEVAKCNRCGFCQAHCPIFDLTRDERNVARGHNAHVRTLVEGRFDLNRDFKDPLFECLLCRACVANCFPAVRTDRNVVAARAEYLRRVGEPKVVRFLFRRLLPDHARLAPYVRLAARGKNSGMVGLAAALGILKWAGRDFGRAAGLVNRLPTTFFRERLGRLRLEPERPSLRAAYFVGCGFNFVLPRVSEATLEVLVGSGVSVRVAENGCCGLPAYGYGDLEAARIMARRNLEALERIEADLVITECGSCSAFLKDYPELFEEDVSLRRRAESLAGRVRGLSEFLHDRLDVAGEGPSLGKVTYHDPCHMSRYQGVVKEPRALLRSLPGLAYVELPEADRCCGAAGSYNVMHYEQSMAVLDRKMEKVKETGAAILATECPGCLIQLSHGARRSGLPIRVMHVSELVRDSFRGKRSSRED